MKDIEAAIAAVGDINLPWEFMSGLTTNTEYIAHCEGPLEPQIRIHHTAQLDKNSRIKANFQSSRLYICDRAKIENCLIEFRGSGSTLVVGPKANVRNTRVTISGKRSLVVIGAATTIGGAHMIAAEQRSIFIGDDCMLSNDIIIRTSDSHGIFDIATGERLNVAKDVILGAHVWLGNGVRLNKGSYIAPGCIVAQASVVSGIQTTASSIYGGVPSRLIRKGVAWSRTGKFEDVPLRFRNAAVVIDPTTS